MELLKLQSHFCEQLKPKKLKSHFRSHFSPIHPALQVHSPVNGLHVPPFEQLHFSLQSLPNVPSSHGLSQWCPENWNWNWNCIFWRFGRDEIWTNLSIQHHRSIGQFLGYIFHWRNHIFVYNHRSNLHHIPFHNLLLFQREKCQKLRLDVLAYWKLVFNIYLEIQVRISIRQLWANIEPHCSRSLWHNFHHMSKMDMVDCTNCCSIQLYNRTFQSTDGNYWLCFCRTHMLIYNFHHICHRHRHACHNKRPSNLSSTSNFHPTDYILHHFYLFEFQEIIKYDFAEHWSNGMEWNQIELVYIHLHCSVQLRPYVWLGQLS